MKKRDSKSAPVSSLFKTALLSVLLLFGFASIWGDDSGLQIEASNADMIFAPEQDNMVRSYGIKEFGDRDLKEYRYQTREGNRVTVQTYSMFPRMITTEIWDITADGIELFDYSRIEYKNDTPHPAPVGFTRGDTLYNENISFANADDSEPGALFMRNTLTSIQLKQLANDGKVYRGIVVEVAGVYGNNTVDDEVDTITSSEIYYAEGIGMVYLKLRDQFDFGRTLEYAGSMNFADFMEIWNTPQPPPIGRPKTPDVYIPAEWNNWTTADRMEPVQAGANVFLFKRWLLPDRTYQFQFWDDSWHGTFELDYDRDRTSTGIITGIPGYAHGNIPVKVPEAGYYLIYFDRDSGSYWIEKATGNGSATAD